MKVEPLVARIRVEYADGSLDEISLLQGGGFPLYGLNRKRADADMRSLGAHSAGAIGSILFRTAVTAERTEYPIRDAKLVALLRQWFAEPQPSKLCEAVLHLPPGITSRSWTLRADNHGHHHGVVNISESPLYLVLSWRATSADAIKRVGIFRLDLNGLLRDGYIRPESSETNGSSVRLRIVRADDRRFYVQTNQDGPRILLADESSS